MKLTKLSLENRNIELRKRANILKYKQYPSDVWLYKQFYKYLDKNDLFNEPIGFYIADLINHKFKYVIECDGISHNTKIRKKKDNRKDRFLIKNGYVVFRVKHNDLNGLLLIIDKILNIRKLYHIKNRRHLLRKALI